MSQDRRPAASFFLLSLAGVLAIHPAGGCDGGGSDRDSGVEQDSGAEAGIDADLRRCGTGNEACGTCHGTVGDPVPPPDTAGRISTSEITVGTHAIHLSGGSFADGVACSECHTEPSNVLDRGHCDSPEPSEVVFGPTATRGGTFPVWNRSNGTCSMVYCHGATMTGGTNTTPDWTSSGTVVCGSCHEQDYHGLTECSCHGTVWAAGQIINTSLHINGFVDM